MITRALLLLLFSPLALADPGCASVHISDPVIVVDKSVGQVQGLATVSMTCTDGLPFAIESPLTPAGLFELSNGTGGLLEGVLRDAETGNPVGPMAHNEHLGLTGTGSVQSIPLRIDVQLNNLPAAGTYSADIVLYVEF